MNLLFRNWNKTLISAQTRWPAQNTHAYHSKGKGKSGGARVITFNVIIAVDETEINLLYLYDKSERSSISANEIEELLQKNGLK